MKIVDLASREERWYVCVWRKSGGAKEYHSAQGVDFEFDDSAYAVIDKHGGLHLHMHDSIDGIHITRENHGTTD